MSISIKNKKNNDNRFSMEEIVFGRRIVMIFICLVLLCLYVELAMAQVIPVKIGNPTLNRYPSSGDPLNVYPRSVWDMHFFNNRIYIGSGDFLNNSGPTDIWSYDGIGFVNEYTVDDEMILDFFEYDNKLFIPGNDATEDWSFENLYINDPNRVPNPGWIKLRTLPGGLHSFCVALFQNKLYANMTTEDVFQNRILVSSDMGQTWTTFISEYGSFIVVTDFLFIDARGAYNGNYYKYDGTTVQKVTPNLFPDWTGSKSIGRIVRFRDGILYAPLDRSLYQGLVDTPLFFLPAGEIRDGGVATRIAKFSFENVFDIVVRDTTCYVMTTEEITKDVSYKGHIYYSSDLTTWSQATEFIVPGIPLSFEIMNNKFYVGLGSRRDRVDLDLDAWVSVGPESGSIWEIDPAASQVEISINLPPTHYSLSQNFPNPFNSSTNISFNLPTKSYVILKVFDFIGQEVATPVSAEFAKGNHSLLWNAADLPSGVYFYRLQAGSFTATKRLVLIK